MDERFSLKDHLFNEGTIAYLAGLLEQGIEGFDTHRFLDSVMEEMLDLELKDRIAHISRVLVDHLDPDFPIAASQIRASLPPPLDPTLGDGDFGDFIFAPFGKFVEDRGLDHYTTSMDLLRELTMRFSMEGPIRAFISAETERTLALFEVWARDDNYHVRRLVSESTRPRLPWAQRIDLDIRAPLPLLDVLHSDTTRYVTRSVANHLNDISKIEPAIVLQKLRAWHGERTQDPDELDWMTRHSLRTLMRRGDLRALELLGYSTSPSVSAEVVRITPVVRPGEALEFTVEMRSRADEKLTVDYVISFVKKDGKSSPKVFKLKQLSMTGGEVAEITKRHQLRANATTYTLYAGTHEVTIVANGMEVARSSFELSTDGER